MERVVREAGIVTNLLDTPRINDVDDVINRDGRFGDVGGQHDLAGPEGGSKEDLPLFFHRNGGVQGKNPAGGPTKELGGNKWTRNIQEQT